MSRNRYSYSASRSHARPVSQRAVVALLIAAGVALLILTRMQHPWITNLRAQLLDLGRPVMEAVHQPVSATREFARSTTSVLETAEENRQLRAENETLRHWQSVAQALKAENTALRALTEYKPVEAATYVTARVIGQSPDALGQYLTINVGEAQGLAPLQPVVDAYGLVGRTFDVASHASRVMLLSDVGSRVPVVTGTSRQRAIAQGTGGGKLQLSFLNDEAKIAIGEPVVTTQEGGLIPGGILVGTVVGREAAGYVVKPVRPLARSEYMRVIQSRAAALPASP